MAGFNLVAVSGTEGICLHWDGSLRPVRFGPGAHVVSTNSDLDEPAMPEKRIFDARFPDGRLPDDRGLREFLRSHEGDRPVCKHGDRYGTVSSTILELALGGLRFLYADGPPCRAEFRDYSGFKN